MGICAQASCTGTLSHRMGTRRRGDAEQEFFTTKSQGALRRLSARSARQYSLLRLLRVFVVNLLSASPRLRVNNLHCFTPDVGNMRWEMTP